MEKVKADTRFRRRVIIEGIIYLIIAFVLLQWVIPNTTVFLMKTKSVYAFMFLEGLIFLILILMILSWVNVLRVGIQCIRQKQYPPKNVPVLRDMMILRDQKAVWRGWLVIGCAFIAILLCVYLCFTLADIVLKMF